jgi:hypothetical protein
MRELTYADVFARVMREAQPDADPALTRGDGQTPYPAADVDAIILSTLRAMTWTAGAVLGYGQIVRPTVLNGTEYIVVVPGVAGVSQEPVWPSISQRWGSYTSGRIADGTAFLEVFGTDSGEYDVELALGRVLQLKADRCGDRIDYSADGVNFKETQTRDYWQTRADRYLKTGAAMIA